MKRTIATIDHDLKGARTALECGPVTVLAGRVNGVGKTASLLAIEIAGTEALAEPFDPGRKPARKESDIVDAVLLPASAETTANIGLSDATQITVTVGREWKRKRGQADPVASHSVKRMVTLDGAESKFDWRLDPVCFGLRDLFDESVTTRRAALLKLLPTLTPTDADFAAIVAGIDPDASGLSIAGILASLKATAPSGVMAIVEKVNGAKNEAAGAAKADKVKLENAQEAVTLHAASSSGATAESIATERARLAGERDQHMQAIGADAQRAALYETAAAKWSDASAAVAKATIAEGAAARAIERARLRLARPALVETPQDEAETASAVTAAEAASGATIDALSAAASAEASARDAQAEARAAVSEQSGAIAALRGITATHKLVTLCDTDTAKIEKLLSQSQAALVTAQNAETTAMGALRTAGAESSKAQAADDAARLALRKAQEAHAARQRHNVGIPERLKLDKAERFAAEGALAAHSTAVKAVDVARLAVAEAEAEVAALAPGNEVTTAKVAIDQIDADGRELDGIEAGVREATRLSVAVKTAKATLARSYAAADLWATIAERAGFKGLAGRMLEAQTAPFDKMLASVYGAMTDGRLSLRLFGDGRECCDFVASPAGSKVEYPLPIFNGANLAIGETAIQVALMNLKKLANRILVRDRIESIAATGDYIAALVRLVDEDLLDQAVVAGCVEPENVNAPGATVIDFTATAQAVAA